MMQGNLISTSGARFSDDHKYRYSLWRDLGDASKRVCFVMLNPSTADADENDPTVRRCMGFAKSWGYGWLTVVNLYAFVSTDPTPLITFGDAVTGDPQNIDAIVDEAKSASLVVLAWGMIGSKVAGWRPLTVIRTLLNAGITELHCLGTTAGGCPRHPLYMRADQPPQLYALARDDNGRVVRVGDKVRGTPNVAIKAEVAGTVTAVDGNRVKVLVEHVEPPLPGSMAPGQEWSSLSYVWEVVDG